MAKKEWRIVGDNSFEKRLQNEENFDAGINMIPTGKKEFRIYPVSIERTSVDRLDGKRQFGIKINIFDTPTEDKLLATVEGTVDFATPDSNSVVGTLAEI